MNAKGPLNEQPVQRNADLEALIAGGDGSSPEEAVTFRLEGLPPEIRYGHLGVQLEYYWLATRFPGSQPLGQELAPAPGKLLDQIRLRLATGEEREFYFDASSFFGEPEGETPASESSGGDTGPTGAGLFLVLAGLLMAVVAVLAWWTHDWRIASAGPEYWVPITTALSLLAWARTIPLLRISRLAGGNMHWVGGAFILVLVVEWRLIWHYLS